MVIALVENGSQGRSPRDLAAQAGLSERAAEAALADLLASGLVRQDSDGFRITENPSDRLAATRLGEIYEANPMAVIRALYERTVSSAVSFAEAFRIRRTPD